MYCKNCGNEIADESVFCNKCGKAIQSDDADDLVEFNAESTLQKKKERKKSFGKGCLNFLVIVFLGIVLVVVGFFFYANSQGSGKDSYACNLLSSLLQQNFGENAAECITFTPTVTSKKGLWFPEFGVIIDGQDIGSAVLSNGTIMHDVIHDYRRDGHQIRVQNWGKRQDYLKN